MPTTKKKTTAAAAKRTPKKSEGTRRFGIDTSFFKDIYQGDMPRFVIGIALLVSSIYILLCLCSNIFTGPADQSGVEAGNVGNAANYGGRLGAYIADYFMNGCFGICSVFIPLFLLLLGVKLMGAYRVRLWKWFINFSFLMIWGSVALSVAADYVIPESVLTAFSFKLGGLHGDFMKEWTNGLIGVPGTLLILLVTLVIYLVYVSRETINVVRKLLKPQDYLPNILPHKKKKEEQNEEPADGEEEEPESDQPQEYSEEYTVALDFSDNPDEEAQPALILSEETPDAPAADTDAPQPTAEGESEMEIEAPEDEEQASGKMVGEVQDMEPYDPRKDLENYRFPTLNLLKHYDDGGTAVDMAEQNANKDRIITVLRSFGVEISGIKATIGPTITLYEVTPAPGVRINKIRNLEDDIALSLSALGIRIIAPIPGKGTIGIEVPNKNPRIVSMESILNSKKFQETEYELPIALGKTITNETFMVDLAKMPHLLVAGATGQGKSVGLNAIITSLLYKKHPAELKFVMVDPKKVEFSVYAPIENHFLAKIPDGEDPIITDVTKVVQTLKSLCQLMDHRYDLLKKAKVRNIKEYNAKFKARRLNPEAGHEYMPYVVVIIDEFGDLIMTAGKEVELPIARIAQLARAVGMHMVIATQRPTTNIITGTIKANFPARMAFKVMSQIDSRTILDRPGANQLVGKGDMLFLSGNDPVRVQCAFVDTPEVEEINNYICRQQSYPCAFELPQPAVEGEGEGGAASVDASNLDPMFEEAARLIVVNQLGSTSLIQRKFSIGYNRAGRLMDQLEAMGIVGPTRGAKPREVLIADEIELDNKLSTIG